MAAATVGLATSILGMLGMALQLFLCPTVHAALGTLRSFRYLLFLFPIAYRLAPYLAVVPSSSTALAPAAGGFISIGITLVLLLQETARTFALPATITLINNCSPHPSVLGTVHGMGQRVSGRSGRLDRLSRGGGTATGWCGGHGVRDCFVSS